MLEFIKRLVNLIFGWGGREPAPTPKPSDLAGRIVATMRRKGYRVDEGEGEINIVFLEGANEDGSPNDNKIDGWNDRRLVLQFERGAPVIVGNWEATTAPGIYWTRRRMNPAGAAQLALGQHQDAWQVGFHRGDRSHESLVQVEPLPVYRDGNEDGKRDGDIVQVGLWGINVHHGYNLPRASVGSSSAGCLVAREITGHRRFMAIVKDDARYKKNPRFKFTVTVMPAAWIEAKA